MEYRWMNNRKRKPEVENYKKTVFKTQLCSYTFKFIAATAWAGSRQTLCGENVSMERTGIYNSH